MNLKLSYDIFTERIASGVALLLLLSTTLLFCGKEKTNEGEAAAGPSKGIGPVSSVVLGPIDAASAEKGRKHFEMKCSACHKFEEKVVGPALKGVTERRTPEWIMNMILNPQEMTQKDPIAMELLAEHLTQMTFQNVQESEAREILEYLRKLDKK
ncbi:c-type cytochrome [Leptospira wolffii]|uniref:C-type cytochrome n=1 Tax=Leptospira wolffii TaxID=409998 RepID=A0A2M9ZB44_9LEPT|nr:cytochrome c [Leptospira wolffii]EPG66810.1 cytochrome C [Leptospira wolffii serovar Khorat str. Khorat-H2]PJZ65630.1 cytochrome C [Leptospira wolffii]TGK56157.1 cytochrome c [Leptospira wolffii]TGK72203.1 cytochrome c [Leptospira wolffii]TGK77507.1 cytochrome c [Leptospira wolffii]